MENNVVFSSRAYRGIVAETYEKVSTETGGIFLGKYNDGKWYILETLDPGPNSIFRPAYFEYDDLYVTHLANKTARFYKNGLDLVGLWHRHPGSFSSFSSTDDETNIKFAKLKPYGAISVLVNLDPDFRMTVYHVTYPPLHYKRIRFTVDDALIPADILAQKSIEDFMRVRGKVVSGFDQPRSPLPRTNVNVNVSKSHLDRKIRSALASIRGTWARIKHWDVHPPYTSYGKAKSSNGAPSLDEMIVNLLESIDNELEYLEAQSEYNYSLRRRGSEITVFMEYRGEMPYYPRRIRFTFGRDSKQSSCYVRMGPHITEYAPGFIQRYVNERIKEAMERLESEYDS